MKLHLILNEEGELISFCFTSGNVSNNNHQVLKHLCTDLSGEMFADASYVSHRLFEILCDQGLQFFTKIRRNMKNKFINLRQKYYLKKRSLVETVINLLKYICDILQTRHRSIYKCFNNMLGALAAYSFFDKHPSIKQFNDKMKIELF